MATDAQSRIQSQPAQPAFIMPPVVETAAGKPRCVGFELEFSGVSLDGASETIASALDAEVVPETSAEHRVQHEALGEFAVEIDWKFLKDQAQETAASDSADWTLMLRELAKALVPVEVVCPPIDIGDLNKLEDVVAALRDAGAEGTNASPLAAFGVHINAETPSMDGETLHRYSRAYCLLQWWLVREHDPDITRRLGPHIDPYPASYLHSIHSLREPSTDELLEHYLDYNDTRNRALDVLPIFAEHDEEAVQSATGDSRIKPRPAFHYRLPNSHIDDDNWTLAQSWNRWCVVEALANDPQAIEELAAEFELDYRTLLRVDKKAWIKRIDQWISDRGLA